MEQGRAGSGANPMDLWMQWYETSTRTWSDVFDGAEEGLVDPWGLYRQWFTGMEEARNRMFGAARSGTQGGTLDGAADAPASDATSALDPTGIMDAMGVAGAMESMDPGQMYRRWFEGATEAWRKSNQFGTGMLDLSQQWTRVLEQAGNNMLQAEGGVPNDPVEFAVKWYNATSGPLGEFVQELLKREDFLEPSSRLLQNYASFYKVFKRNSEEYLRTLQIPTRSDITRVATLVVNLEDKVDRIEEAFEDFEYGYAEPATAGSVASLEERLDGVEGKLDRLLAAVEGLQSGANGEANAPANAPATVVETNGGAAKATGAARRKAEEMGVNLAEVEGTGADGQITVSDVRKKGES